MTMLQAKAFRVTDHSRPILQSFIQEQIPDETNYVLAAPNGYLFLTDEPGHAEDGMIRLPKFTMLSYYDIEYETE